MDDNFKEAITIHNDDFNWNRLLSRIKRKEVVPVIGQGLYRIKLNSEGKNDISLYDYLADKLLEECEETNNLNGNHKFAKACYIFLEKNRNDFLPLSDFLKAKLNELKKKNLIIFDTLLKLAKIKGFELFLNTTYDDFLTKAIKDFRSVPTEEFYYTLGEKKFEQLNDAFPSTLHPPPRTLIYNIFGNLESRSSPAYTERDMLETMMEFHEDMVKDSQNKLFKKLEEKSLLFVGCGYSDWLFRFFIRTMANEAYGFLEKKKTCNFVGDDFLNNNKYPFRELHRFLRNHETEIFCSTDGFDFIERLLEKLNERDPDEILSSMDLTKTAFISYEGGDRSAAVMLASNLTGDGFHVWLDKKTMGAGDKIDETIIRAINKCPVFIPLISQNSQKIKTEDGHLKYHIREWERAYTNKVSGENVEILPVKIEDTDWIYSKFNEFNHIKIPNGSKLGDYEKLKDKLSKIRSEKK